MEASASSTTPDTELPGMTFPVAGINDGDRKGVNWEHGGGWRDGTNNSHPDWAQVEFAGEKAIDEINVFTLQDATSNPSEPTEAMTFAQYGVTAYEVQYLSGADWVTVPGGSVSGNNKVWRRLTFPAVMTSKVRVLIHGALAGRSRLVEVEAWGADAGSTTADVRWLVSDHLGTPRMVVDQTGSLSKVIRRDYLPFGEEIGAGIGGRTATQGYLQFDGVRMQYTGKERDSETRLDYFLARYYSSAQGRFTSVDPGNAGASENDPQSWNGYAYARSSPLVYTDPDGREYLICDSGGKNCRAIYDEDFYKDRKSLERGGLTFTGNRDFFESGQIRDADGNVTATYVQISIDDQVRQNIFAIRGAVSPIPKATLQFFGLSIAGGVTGGYVYYKLAASAAVTTLGIGTTVARPVVGRTAQIIITEIEKEVVRSGARNMGERALAIDRALSSAGGKLGRSLKAIGKMTAEGLELHSRGQITKIGWDGTIRIIDKATGQVLKVIK